MPSAPLGQDLLTRAGEILMLGGSSVFGLLMMVGAGVYLWLCLRSNRQWDGYEQRWVRPRHR